MIGYFQSIKHGHNWPNSFIHEACLYYEACKVRQNMPDWHLHSMMDDHSYWKKYLSDNHEKLIKLIVVIACDKSMVNVELSCMVSEKCTQDMNWNLGYKHKNVQIL